MKMKRIDMKFSVEVPDYIDPNRVLDVIHRELDAAMAAFATGATRGPVELCQGVGSGEAVHSA